MTAIPDDKLFRHAHRVKDSVVVITGAANGIGKETALRFAEHGAKVVIGDLDIVNAEKTVQEIGKSGGQAVAVRCNVTVWDDQVALFELAMKRFGSVDVVVPNAGVSEIGAFTHVVLQEDGKPSKPNLKTLDVNLTGVTYTAHLAIHYLNLNRKPGSLKSLTMIGSMASWSAIPRAAMYTASKHAVLGIMRSLHLDFLAQEIRVGSIHPFFADTGIVPAHVKLFLAGIPLTPVSRVAGAIFYAATDPDFESSGSAWLLTDDGPVFQVPKEEFKMGVYKMIDERANSLRNGASGMAYYAHLTRDVVRILRKPLLVAAVGAGAARLAWTHRETLLSYIH